ncbi:unnamed protein product, partial [Allacma fusca]
CSKRPSFSLSFRPVMERLKVVAVLYYT